MKFSKSIVTTILVVIESLLIGAYVIKVWIAIQKDWFGITFITSRDFVQDFIFIVGILACGQIILLAKYTNLYENKE